MKSPGLNQLEMVEDIRYLISKLEGETNVSPTDIVIIVGKRHFAMGHDIRRIDSERVQAYFLDTTIPVYYDITVDGDNIQLLKKEHIGHYLNVPWRKEI